MHVYIIYGSLIHGWSGGPRNSGSCFRCGAPDCGTASQRHFLRGPLTRSLGYSVAVQWGWVADVR